MEFKGSGCVTPNKALPWKNYILDKHYQGMSNIKIHEKLLEEFPEASDIKIHSINRLIKKIKDSNKGKSKDKTSINKSEVIRKLAREMISNGLELNCHNICKTLANRGVKVSYSHITMAIGTAVLSGDKQIKFNEIDANIECSFSDLVVAKEFVEKLGGIERAVGIINKYKGFDNATA